MAAVEPIEAYDDDAPSPEWILNTMEVLEKATWRPDAALEEIFPVRVFSKLLKDSRRIFEKEPTVVDIEVPRDARINIVSRSLLSLRPRLSFQLLPATDYRTWRPFSLHSASSPLLSSRVARLPSA